MDDETIVEAVDFSEFEALFQMKRFVAKQSRTEVDGEPAYCCTFLVTIVWWCVFTGDTKIVRLDLFDNKRQRGIGQSNILHSTLYFELHVLIKISIIFLVAVFAKRRIRLNPLYISQFILNTDLNGLLSEHCELLLQIVPQEKEVHHCTHTHTHTHTAWLFNRCCWIMNAVNITERHAC